MHKCGGNAQYWQEFDSIRKADALGNSLKMIGVQFRGGAAYDAWMAFFTATFHCS